MDTLNMFEHQPIEYDKVYRYVVSPSLLWKFYSAPEEWYKETIYQEKGFLGSTASCIGTICHYIYKVVSDNKGTKGLDIDDIKAHIEWQLNEYVTKNGIDVDINEVLTIYPQVCNVVLNEYVRRNSNIQIATEKSIYMDIDTTNGIALAGTCDRYEYDGHILCDYKTVSTKPSTDKIPSGYKMQLMCYAKILRDRYNMPVDSIRLIYGVKPTKTLPARCFVVTEDLFDYDYIWIENILKLVCTSINLCDTNKDLIPVIFRQLKETVDD